MYDLCVCVYHLAKCDESHKSSLWYETQRELQRLLPGGEGQRERREGGGGGGGGGGGRGIVTSHSEPSVCVCVP